VTLEEYLYRRLADTPGVAALVGLGGSPADAKIFPVLVPQHRTKGVPPYVVHQRVAGAPLHDLSGPAAQNTRIQFACRAATWDEMDALAEAVRAALDGLDATVAGWGRITAVCVSAIDLYDDTPKSFARALDFSVFHPG
jgi:hypothetical protein